MKPRVELIYDRDCPNAAEARAALPRAFVVAGVHACNCPNNGVHLTHASCRCILLGSEQTQARHLRGVRKMRFAASVSAIRAHTKGELKDDTQTQN